MANIRRENYFTEDKIDVAIAVDTRYWFNKIGRIRKDLADLYNLLFPLQPGGLRYQKTDEQKRAEAQSRITAKRLWESIKEDPQSPPGPLTLATICKAVAEGTDFDDPSDRRAFFELMEHNKHFQALFSWGMIDKNARLNSVDDLAQSMLKDEVMFSHVRNYQEAQRLSEVWNLLYYKIRFAINGRRSEFYKELFEFAPTVARHYPCVNSTAQEDSLKFQAIYYTGIMAAAVLGFETENGRLNSVFEYEDIRKLLSVNIKWQEVNLRGRVSGNFDMKSFYKENKTNYEPAAFLAQLESNDINFRGLDLALISSRGESYDLTQADANIMFEELAWVTTNALVYFYRYRPFEINALIRSVSNLRLSGLNPEERDITLEIRSRLYHPLTIKAMAEFWKENFDAFTLAAGENDQYLEHLFKHMPDPVNFLKYMLRKDSNMSSKYPQAKRWAYFAPRLTKILPVIAKTQGAKAEKAIRELLRLKLRSEIKNRYLIEDFRSEVEKLMDQAAGQLSDSAQTLLALLDDQSTREYSIRSANQILRCLKGNARSEAVIARDDRLFDTIGPPVNLINKYVQMISSGESVSDDEQLAKFNALYPTLWARFTLNHWVMQVGLRAYVKQSGLLQHSVHSSSEGHQASVRFPQLSVREAFVIASHESYWNKINPYRRHPFRAFFEWLIPGSQTNYFDKKKSKLASKSPILALRMEWEKNRSQDFDQYLVDRLNTLILPEINHLNGEVITQQTKKEWAELIADIGRGPALLALSQAGDLAVPQNLSRVKAFLAEVNTLGKLKEAYDFILKINPANIDAEAIFQLITRDEAVEIDAQEPGKTFWGLAKELIGRNPSVLPEILELYVKRKQKLSPEVLTQLLSFILDGDFVLSYQSTVSEEVDGLIQRLIIEAKVQNTLTADQLLRIRNISQVTFEMLIKSKKTLSDQYEKPSDIELSLCDTDRSRGTHLVNRLFEMQGDELAQVGVMGLGSLFKMYPECLYDVLLKLPSVDSPDNGSEADKKDIFRLYIPGNRWLDDLSFHPFYDYMMSTNFDFGQIDNIKLVIRCINSRNEYLSKLMRQVMMETLGNNDNVANVRLLVAFIFFQSEKHDSLEEILSEGGKLRKEIEKLILNKDFIEVLSSAAASGNGQLWLKVWLVLLHSPSFRLFINNLSFNKSDSNAVVLACRLSRYYDLFKREHLEEIPVLKLPAPDPKSTVPSLAYQSGLFRPRSVTPPLPSTQAAVKSDSLSLQSSTEKRTSLALTPTASPSKAKGLPGQSTSSPAARKKPVKITDPVAALDEAYNKFNDPPFEGQEEWREELVQTVLKNTKIFSDLKSWHFAVLLAISPEKTGPAIATYLSQDGKAGMFDAIISDQKTGILSIILNRTAFKHYSQFRPLLLSWIVKEGSAKKHYRCPAVIQWLHQNKRIGHEDLWSKLMGELSQGQSRELLSIQPIVGPVLWERLIEYLNVDEKRSEREKCLKDDQFLSGYLRYLTQTQRMFMFNAVSDGFLMQRIFGLCASTTEFMNVLFSVLLRFTEINNPIFYQVLKEYPHFFDYALNVVELKTLESFLEKNKEQPWCTPELFKKKEADQAVKAYYSEADRRRIISFLNSIHTNSHDSRELEDDLLMDYYSVGDKRICSRILANPDLLSRILLSVDKRITIEWTTHIQNLLAWMVDVVQAEAHKKSVNFLLVEKRMTPYFIGAIEWFFMQALRADYKDLSFDYRGFLGCLFKHFGSDFFGGITREQLALLVKIHGDNTHISGEFNEAFPRLVNSYRTLIPNEDEELSRRWKETVETQAEFVQEFRYRGPDDDMLWMRLLECNWRGKLDEESILDRVMKNATGLNLVGFLRAHSQNGRLNNLFTKKQRVAEKILSNPKIFAGCGFTLENFVCWNLPLLRSVLQDSSLHKIAGFTPEHFYRLAFSSHRERVFGKQGIVAELFSYKNGNENSNANGLLYLQGFLRDTFLTAPTYVKELMPIKTKPRVEDPKARVQYPEHRVLNLNPPKSWEAKREEYQAYQFTDSFEAKLGKDRKRRYVNLGQNRSPELVNAYIKENSRQEHLFIKELLGTWDIKRKLKQNKDSVSNGDSDLNQIQSFGLNELNDILCGNKLLRKIGIMRNPNSLREDLKNSMNFECDETVYSIQCFLQLPGFRPTTEDLSPGYLRFNKYDVAIQKIVEDSPVSMVEYLIDLCHFNWDGWDKREYWNHFKDKQKSQIDAKIQFVVKLIFGKAKILVEKGIARFFVTWEDYQNEINDEQKAKYYFDRFFCLLCNAIEWLSPEAFSDLFKIKGTAVVRDQVCEYSLRHNCNITAVSEVPTLVELQLHLLRSYVRDLTKSANPSPEEKKCLEKVKQNINNILWHLRCIPAEALQELAERKVVLEMKIWKHLLWSPLISNWLRYETLTSTLSERDLVELVRDAKNADIARACLMNVYLHERCEGDLFVVCADKLGYGDDPMEMVKKLKNEMGLVIQHSPQLQEWVRSIESPQEGYDY